MSPEDCIAQDKYYAESLEIARKRRPDVWAQRERLLMAVSFLNAALVHCGGQAPAPRDQEIRWTAGRLRSIACALEATMGES